MNYKLVWLPRAKAHLLRILENAERYVEVFRAYYRIEALLEHFADVAGESRDKGRRVILEHPLTVYYRIDEAAKTVRVLRVFIPSP